MLGTQIVILLIFILLSAISSGIETALISINMIKVRSLVRQKKKGSEALHRIKQNPRKMIITILLVNTSVNIGSGAVAAVVFTNLFGSTGIGLATGIMTFLILIFGEITPKTFAAQNAEKISLLAARPVELVSYSLSPIIGFFELISETMLKLVGTKKEKLLSEEELKTMVTMGREEGILDKEAAEMMQNILEFEGTKVTAVMTPEINIDAVDGKAKLNEVIDFVVKTPYSRYPVYLGHKDKIIGILDVDDVLKYAKNKRLGVKVKNIARPIFFVPETKEIDDLLSEFQGKKIPLAIVVDEYGHVSGLVTIEDVLEEIVGDIFDKSQRSSIYIKKVSDKLIRVDAKASIEELNKILHLGLKKEHFDTIAGFIEHKLQRIPKKGEQIRLKNVIIEIDRVSKQRIKSVKMIKV